MKDPAVAHDLRRAEELLFDIAADLRRVPVHAGTRDFHLRALAAKRNVSLWANSPPPDDERRRTLEELVAIQEDVRRWLATRRASAFARYQNTSPNDAPLRTWAGSQSASSGCTKHSSAAHHFPVRNYMTTATASIRPDDTLANARRLMAQIRARFLPVVAEGRLVGLLSTRDLVDTGRLPQADASRLVSAAMQTDFYCCSPDTPLDEVATTLASSQYECAVIWNGSSVVGIFTAADGMNALASLLRSGMPA